APFFDTATHCTGFSAPAKVRSLAPLARFHIFTLLSSDAVRTCVPLGASASPRTGFSDAATSRWNRNVWTVAFLSAPPETMVVLLGWKATAWTGPVCGNASISLPAWTSQTRASLSSAPVTIRDLSALYDSDVTTAGCFSVATSLPSAAFQMLTTLPAAPAVAG